MFSPESSYEEIHATESQLKSNGEKEEENRVERPAWQASTEQVENTTKDESASASVVGVPRGGDENEFDADDEREAKQGTIDEKDRSHDYSKVQIKDRQGDDMADQQKEDITIEKQELQEKTETKASETIDGSYSKTTESAESTSVTKVNDGEKTQIDTEMESSEKTIEKHGDADPVETATSHHSSHSQMVDDDDVVINMTDLGHERVVGEVTEGGDTKKGDDPVATTLSQEAQDLKKEGSEQTEDAIAKGNEKADEAKDQVKEIDNNVKQEGQKVGNKVNSAAKKCCAPPKRDGKNVSAQQRNAQNKSKQQEEEECCCVLM